MRFARLRNTVQRQQPVELVLHIGEKAISEKTGKEHPKSLDFFKADGMYAERFYQHYTEKATVIKIFFPTNDLRRIAQVFKEFRNSGGIPIARISTDWTLWNSGIEPLEIFEIFRYKEQQWESVDEQEFDTFIQDKPLTERDTLRLFFWIEELMKEGNYVTCQIETRGSESSIPAILNMLQDMASAQKLQFPFRLCVSKNEGKGVNEKGENKKRIYSVLSLVPDFSEQAMLSLMGAVNTFKSLQAGAPVIQSQLQESQQKALPETHKEPEDSPEVEPFSEDLIEKGRDLANQIEAFNDNKVKGIRKKFDTLLETRIQHKDKEDMIIATDEDLQGVLNEMTLLLQRKQSNVLQSIYKTTEKFIAEHRDALLKESESKFGEAFNFDLILSDMIECVNGAGKFIGQSFEDRRDGLQDIYETFSRCLQEEQL